MQELTLSFRYSEKEYVRAIRAHHAADFNPVKDVLFVTGALAAGMYIWLKMGLRWQGGLFLISAVLLGLARVMLFLVTPMLLFRRNPKLREDYVLTFSEEGIHFRTTNIDSRLLWPMFSHARITAEAYLLYYGAQQFTVIPKRVFASPEEHQIFEELLRAHVPNIMAKKGKG